MPKALTHWAISTFARLAGGRDQRGICVADPFASHQGAFLSPAYGWRVVALINSHYNRIVWPSILVTNE